MVSEQHHRDEEGRLLRESRAPADCILPGEIEYKPCPYGGSRAVLPPSPPLPMNVSALRATSASWDDIINAVALLRVAYTEGRATAAMEVMDVWRVSQLGSALPWFFILGRGERSPAYAANLAKATLGMGLWGQRVFARMISEHWSPPPLTAEVIHELAEANGTLVGETEVCSGPEKMLLRFYAALLDLVPDTTSPHLSHLVANRDAVVRFGAHYLNMKLALYVLFLARRFVYADVLAALPDVGLAPQLRELLHAPCEPPDFFTVAPTDMAALAPEHRLAWFAQLAAQLVPCAPDASDAPLRGAMVQLATTMAVTAAPPLVTAEVAALHGCSQDAAARVARALATWAQLDTIHGFVLGVIENGLRAATGAPLHAAAITATERDQLVQHPARWLLARLAPQTFPALLPP